MKILITNYTFDKTAKTVTFTDYATIRLDSVLLITNTTSNVIIYNFSNPLKGGTVATNVLTLIYDTSAMSNTDKLQIFYQDENVSMGAVTETAPASDTASSGLNGRLQRIAQRITSFIALLPSALTGSGNLKVANQEALPAGTNLLGKVGIDQTTPGTTNKVSVGADVVSTTEVAPTTIINGKTTVTTATTRVQLATNTCKSITVKALAVNTGIIYVGNATVAAANGFQLAAGDSVTMDISNTNVVYIDSSVNGEGVSFIANN